METVRGSRTVEVISSSSRMRRALRVRHDGVMTDHAAEPRFDAPATDAMAGPSDEVRHADRWWRWGSHLVAMLVLAAACAASWGLLITSAGAEQSLRGGAAEPWMPLALWFVAGPLFAAVVAGLGRARHGSTGSSVCARWGLLAVVSTAGLFAATVGVLVVVVQPWGALRSDAVLFLDVALLMTGVVSHIVGALVGLRARAR